VKQFNINEVVMILLQKSSSFFFYKTPSKII
jgi:hypothetical protein